MKLIIRRYLKKILFFFIDKVPLKPTEIEKKYYENFIYKLNSLPKVNLNPTWEKFIGEFYENVKMHKLNEFIRWPIIYKTMGDSFGLGLIKEFNYVKKHTAWDEKLKFAIIDTGFGYPEPFFLYPKSSGLTIHNLYHILQFQSTTGREISSFDNIFEFGGGFGNMCRLIHKLGFTGEYTIYDIPEFSCLQKLYLQGHELISSKGIDITSDKIKLISTLKESEKGDAQFENNKKTLFIATWSLSESPIDLREKILKMLPSECSFLIAYQSHFDEISNVEYFDNIMNSFNTKKWIKLPIKQLSGSYYLFGN